MYRSLAIGVVALALLAIAFWTFRGGAPGGPKAAFEGARVEVREGVTVVRLAGPPRAKGRAMGEALKARIRAELERALPEDPGVRDFVVRTAGEKLGGFLPADYREEIEGIAEGAGISFDEALFLNTRYELAAHGLAREEGDIAGEGAVGPGPEAGHLFAEEAARDLVVVVHEDRDPPLALVARPGMAGGFLGVAGNVAAALRPIRSDTPPDLGGLVWTLLLRRLLEDPPEGRYEPPAHVTGPVSVAMALPDGAAGTLSLAVWGTAWYAGAGGYSLTTDEPAAAREREPGKPDVRDAADEVLLGQRGPAEQARIGERATRLLGDPPPPGQRLVSLRGGEGIALIVVGPGGRHSVQLR